MRLRAIAIAAVLALSGNSRIADISASPTLSRRPRCPLTFSAAFVAAWRGIVSRLAPGCSDLMRERVRMSAFGTLECRPEFELRSSSDRGGRQVMSV